MKKLKLGFTDTNEHIAQFFYYNLLKRYDIEIDNEKPDFLIFGDENFGTDNKNFHKKDCIKIFFTGENRRPENYDCHYGITFDHNFNSWHYRLPLFIVYMWSLEHIHKTEYKYNYILSPHVKPKTDFCSFVVSNPSCPERNAFFEKLNAIKPVDSAGQFMNNTGIKLEGEQAKIDFLSSRKFNICFESGKFPGYVTEKILHAFYAGTVPIYWGSPTVTVDFNSGAFINAHRFSSQEELIDFVLYVDKEEEIYQKMVAAPKFAYNIPPSYYFIDNFLNWFDAIVYNKIETRDANTFIHF
jgi:hypothetical protein